MGSSLSRRCQEGHGGWLNVEAASVAHFFGDVDVHDYLVESDAGTGSFADDTWDGGCVWNQVRIVVSLMAIEMLLTSMRKSGAIKKL